MIITLEERRVSRFFRALPFIIEDNEPLYNEVFSNHVYKVYIVTALTTQSVALMKSFNN